MVGISSDSTDPSYLVALDAFGTGHSGSSTSLFIGSNKSITNDNGWYFQATSLKPIGTTTQALSGTVTGTATGNTTHTVIIGGRTGLDGTRYDINIETGDTVAEISAKIEDAITASSSI